MNEETIRSYKDLQVWQKSIELVTRVYRLTATFPTTERFGLSSQMQRSAVSIPSNIAEGSRRGSKRDFRQFVLVAYGSGSELETQIEICKRLELGTPETFAQIDELLDHVMRMTNRLISKLSE